MVKPPSGLSGSSPASTGHQRNPTLRGRDGEMEVVGELLDAARRGSGSVLLIDGEAGLGKSRLIDEAVRVAGRLSIAAGSSGNAPGSTAVPIAPILSALFDGQSPLLDRKDIGDLHALPDHRYWLFQEIQDLLERRARATPMLISIDDLQWADRGTIAALRTLAPATAGSPIVWLAAFRRNEASLELLRGVDELRELGAQSVSLSPLDQSAVDAVVSDVLGASADDGVLQVARRAQGVPFLLIELLLGLIEEQLVSFESGEAALIDTKLPARVTESMRVRLERMSPSARGAATAASVLGRSFTFSALGRMLDLQPSQLLESVEELVRAGLIVDAGDELRFRHDLIGQAVLDSISASARRALDRQAADVLLDGGALPVEIAGRLVDSAVEGDTMAAQTLHKAALAIGPSDPAMAGDLGRKALSLISRDDPERVALVKETALLLHLSGQADEARAFAAQALAEVLTPVEQSQVLLSIATMFTLTAEVRVEAGRDSLELAQIPASLRALHLAVLVLNLVAAGLPDEARTAEAEAAELIEETGDGGAELALGLSRLGLLEIDGEYEAMLEQANAFERLGDTPEERTTKGSAEWFSSNALAATDRLDEALELITRGLEAAKRDRQGWMVPRWELWRGRFLFQQGQLLDAQAVLEAVFSEPLISSPVPIEPDAAGLLALSRVATHVGNGDLTRKCEQIARETLAMGQREGRRQLAWLLAQQAMARGDVEAAISEFDPPAAGEQASVLPGLALDNCDFPQLARLARASGKDDLADWVVHECERRRVLNPSASSIAASAHHARGIVDDDLAELEKAVEAFEATPRPLALASALEDLGARLAAGGRRDEGVAALGRALELYVGCGARWDGRRVRGRLRDLGVRRRIATSERPESGWGSLTDSELEVARLVAEGLTNREVAERLYISPHTVSTHLRHTFAKLDINSRVELARFALEHE